MKLEEAAQTLGVTRETIQRWISRGQIKVQESRRGRRHWEITQKELQRIQAERSQKKLPKKVKGEKILERLESLEDKLDKVLGILTEEREKEVKPGHKSK